MVPWGPGLACARRSWCARLVRIAFASRSHRVRIAFASRSHRVRIAVRASAGGSEASFFLRQEYRHTLACYRLHITLHVASVTWQTAPSVRFGLDSWPLKSDAAEQP